MNKNPIHQLGSLDITEMIGLEINITATVIQEKDNSMRKLQEGISLVCHNSDLSAFLNGRTNTLMSFFFFFKVTD